MWLRQRWWAAALAAAQAEAAVWQCGQQLVAVAVAYAIYCNCCCSCCRQVLLFDCLVILVVIGGGGVGGGNNFVGVGVVEIVGGDCGCVGVGCC